MAVPIFGALFPIVFLQSGITGFIWSTIGSMSAGCVLPREQGQLAGVNAALGGLTAALGPLWAGVAYDTIVPSAPFWSAAAILLLACVVLARVKPVALQGAMPALQANCD
jgi:hypothetical protein